MRQSDDARRPKLRAPLRLSVLVYAAVVFCGQPVWAGPCDLPEGARAVYVRDFQAAGDGKTDDGPAIRAALESVLAGSKPAALEFDPGKTYRIASFEGRYALQLLNTQQVMLRGNGAELLLLPPNKVLRVENSSDINVCGLAIDYSPLPFTQGLVTAVDPASGTLDLKIEDGFDVPAVDKDSVADNRVVWRFAVPFSAPQKFTRRVQISAVYATDTSRKIRIK